MLICSALSDALDRLLQSYFCLKRQMIKRIKQKILMEIFDIACPRGEGMRLLSSGLLLYNILFRYRVYREELKSVDDAVKTGILNKNLPNTSRIKKKSTK